MAVSGVSTEPGLAGGASNAAMSRNAHEGAAQRPPQLLWAGKVSGRSSIYRTGRRRA